MTETAAAVVLWPGGILCCGWSMSNKGTYLSFDLWFSTFARNKSCQNAYILWWIFLNFPNHAPVQWDKRLQDLMYDTAINETIYTLRTHSEDNLITIKTTYWTTMLPCNRIHTANFNPKHLVRLWPQEEVRTGSLLATRKSLLKVTSNICE